MLRMKRRGPVFAAGVGVLTLSLLIPGFAAQATDGGEAESTAVSTSAVFENAHDPGLDSGEVEVVSGVTPESKLGDMGENSEEVNAVEGSAESNDAQVNPVRAGMTAEVCGYIEGVEPQELQHLVIEAENVETRVIEKGRVNASGFYCFLLPPGNYIILYRMSEVSRTFPRQYWRSDGRSALNNNNAEILRVKNSNEVNLAPIRLYQATSTFNGVTNLPPGADISMLTLGLVEFVDHYKEEVNFDSFSQTGYVDEGEFSLPILSEQSRFHIWARVETDGKKYTAVYGSDEMPLPKPSEPLVLEWVEGGGSVPAVISFKGVATSNLEWCDAQSDEGISFYQDFDSVLIGMKGRIPMNAGSVRVRISCSAGEGVEYRGEVTLDIEDRPIEAQIELVKVERQGSEVLATLDHRGYFGATIALVPLDTQDNPMVDDRIVGKELAYPTPGHNVSMSFKPVPPGRYLLSASYMGGGNTYYGGDSPNDAIKITVPETALYNTYITFAVPKVASIGGTIRSDVIPFDFLPAKVVLYRWEEQKWVPKGTEVVRAKYSFESLGPGDYTIGVEAPDKWGRQGLYITSQGLSTPTAFYPYCAYFYDGGTTLEDAKAITIASAQNLTLSPIVLSRNCPELPIIPGDVQIAGIAAIGQTVKAIPGSWQPGKVHLEYQWLADGQPIEGATSDSLVITKNLWLKKLSVRVTGSHPQYTTKVALSPEAVVQGSKPQVSAPKIELPNTQLRSGVKVVVSGEGFDPEELISLFLHSDPIHLADVRADDKGRFSTSVELPSSTPVGAHHIRATGVASKKMVEVAVTVSSASSGTGVVPGVAADNGSSAGTGMDSGGDSGSGTVADTSFKDMAQRNVQSPKQTESPSVDAGLGRAQTGAASKGGADVARGLTQKVGVEKGPEVNVRVGKSGLASTGTVSVFAVLAVTAAGGTLALMSSRHKD